jgi:hypothetical protein
VDASKLWAASLIRGWFWSIFFVAYSRSEMNANGMPEAKTTDQDSERPVGPTVQAAPQVHRRIGDCVVFRNTHSNLSWLVVE